MRLPIQIATQLFRISEGKVEYLLLKRIPKRGGFWQYITGGLEEGESMHDCMMREVAEETGITILKRVIDNIHSFQFEGGPVLSSDTIKLLSEYVFAAEVDADVEVVLHKNIYVEHDEFRWCSFEEAMKLIKYDSNKEALTKLQGLLKK